MGKSKYRGLTHDGTTGQAGKMVAASVSGANDGDDKPQVLSLGSRIVASGTAADGAAAMIDLIALLGVVAAAAGRHDLVEKLNITMFNEGTMTDHAPGEDAIDDILEGHILLSMTSSRGTSASGVKTTSRAGGICRACTNGSVSGSSGITAFNTRLKILAKQSKQQLMMW